MNPFEIRKINNSQTRRDIHEEHSLSFEIFVIDHKKEVRTTLTKCCVGAKFIIVYKYDTIQPVTCHCWALPYFSV